MAENDFKEALNTLDEHIGEILKLVLPPDKLEAASNLLTRYTKEVYEKITPLDSKAEVIDVYDPFINNVMSIVETLIFPNTVPKPTRKLILNELYKMRDKTILPAMSKD